MRERVVVTGVGIVCAAGVGREAFFSALTTGASGISAHPRAAEDGVRESARVGDFGARRVLEPRSLRRLTRLSQMALVAAKEALAQAAPTYDADRTGIVLGTGLGTMRETMDFIHGYVAAGPEAASPLLFPSSVMNAAAGQMAIELELRGPNSTVNHRDGSTESSLMMAADLLALGRADALLVGGVDELSEVAALGYGLLGRLAQRGMRPYAKERDGTVPGEGAAIMVLERESDARARGAPILARIAGFAAASEHRARVGWSPAPAGGVAPHGREGALETAIRGALDDAGASTASIDYVAGQGSGLAVDGIEARAIARVFAQGLDRPVPHGSILGQTGEFMSAGALRVASALFAIDRQHLPGTARAGEPDPDAPVPGLVRDPRSATVRRVLVPTLSQGGAASALVLERVLARAGDAR